MKKHSQTNSFDQALLSEDEQLLEQVLETGPIQEEPDFENTKAMLEEAAKQHDHLNTSKPITIRVNQLDLIKLKARAKKKQIPYQTLLGALIHQYAEGNTAFSL